MKKSKFFLHLNKRTFEQFKSSPNSKEIVTNYLCKLSRDAVSQLSNMMHWLWAWDISRKTCWYLVLNWLYHSCQWQLSVCPPLLYMYLCSYGLHSGHCSFLHSCVSGHCTATFSLQADYIMHLEFVPLGSNFGETDLTFFCLSLHHSRLTSTALILPQNHSAAAVYRSCPCCSNWLTCKSHITKLHNVFCLSLQKDLLNLNHWRTHWPEQFEQGWVYLSCLFCLG